jgi:Tol biopolymer transport system component
MVNASLSRRIAQVAFEIWVCNRDGSNAVQLTSFASANNVCCPVWSPDGHTIYFTAASQDGKTASYVISSEGGSPRGSGDHPAGWSRDGKWMYFSAKRSGQDQLWKMPVNGGSAFQVTKKGAAVPMESPDGRYLYYLKGMSETRSSVWEMNEKSLEP